MVAFSQLQLDIWLSGLLLPFLRILALFSAAPVLSSRSLPMRARVGLAFAIAVVVAPFASVPEGLPLASMTGLGLVIQQVLIGLTLGFAARLLFAVFEVAGELIGLQMGFPSPASSTCRAAANPPSAPGCTRWRCCCSSRWMGTCC